MLQPYIAEKLDLDKYYFMLECKQKYQLMSPTFMVGLLSSYIKKKIDKKFLQERAASFVRNRDYFGDFYVSPGFDKPNAAEIVPLYEPMWRIIEEIADPKAIENMTSFKARQYIKKLDSLPKEHY